MDKSKQDSSLVYRKISCYSGRQGNSLLYFCRVDGDLATDLVDIQRTIVLLDETGVASSRKILEDEAKRSMGSRTVKTASYLVEHEEMRYIIGMFAGNPPEHITEIQNAFRRNNYSRVEIGFYLVQKLYREVIRQMSVSLPLCQSRSFMRNHPGLLEKMIEA